MFPVEDGDETELSADRSVAVGVNFNGTVSGRIVLQVEDCVLPVIAANMLGEEEPVAEELMYDVLGELANVICGNALPTIAGKTEVFKLEPPQLLEGAPAAAEPAAEAHLALEEGFASVTLYLN